MTYVGCYKMIKFNPETTVNPVLMSILNLFTYNILGIVYIVKTLKLNVNNYLKIINNKISEYYNKIN